VTWEENIICHKCGPVEKKVWEWYCPFGLGRTRVAPVLERESGSRIMDKITFVECAIVIHGDFAIGLEVMWKS